MKFSFFCNSKDKTVILFYGHAGWIGGMYIEYLKSQHPGILVINGKARIDYEEEVVDEINEYKPTHIVSFTGRTHGVIDGKPVNTIDYLEYPGRLVENVRDNLFGPVQLAMICKERGLHYTYLGTGCIFNSYGPQKFTENSLPNYFGSGYSVVKGFTDRLIGKYPVLNLRIRMPISSTVNPRNFITKITKYEYVCSIANSMTVLDDFFPVFTSLIVRKRTGTYNCTNPGTISHNEILKLYRQIVDHDFTWKNMSLEEQNRILKSERSNNHLDTTKIELEFPKLRNIHDSIIVTLNKMSLRVDSLPIF